MAADIFSMVGISEGKRKAKSILESGRAYSKMKEIIRAQHGSIFNPSQVKIGKFKHDEFSPKSGIVAKIDNVPISRIARIAGAPADKGAGIYLYAHVGSRVKKGDKLFTVYSESAHKLSFARESLKSMPPFLVK